jgi:hypothetical protein
MSVHCVVRRTTPAAADAIVRAVSTGATQRVSHTHSLKYHNPHRRPLKSQPLFLSPPLWQRSDYQLSNIIIIIS